MNMTVWRQTRTTRKLDGGIAGIQLWQAIRRKVPGVKFRRKNHGAGESKGALHLDTHHQNLWKIWKTTSWIQLILLTWESKRCQEMMFSESLQTQLHWSNSQNQHRKPTTTAFREVSTEWAQQQISSVQALPPTERYTTAALGSVLLVVLNPNNSGAFKAKFKKFCSQAAFC